MSGLNITQEERELCAAQSRESAHDAVCALHYLGSYEREIPVSLTRMMENAHDWEHLPFVHPTAFADIALVESGSWGWQAKVELPPRDSGNVQLLQLLTDNARHYWATSVLSGAGQGVQIHTQATALDADRIKVDVRFYAEDEPDEMQAKAGFAYLQALYAQLYDEDEALMRGRQEALDRTKSVALATRPEADLGAVGDVQQQLPMVFELDKKRFCLNQLGGEWIAYGATCPHLLGPLEQGTLFADGSIMCPWHGYTFDARTGASRDGKCGNLPAPPRIAERAGRIIASL